MTALRCGSPRMSLPPRCAAPSVARSSPPAPIRMASRRRARRRTWSAISAMRWMACWMRRWAGRAAQRDPRCADRRYHPRLVRGGACAAQCWRMSTAEQAGRMRRAFTRLAVRARDAGHRGMIIGCGDYRLATVFDTYQQLKRSGGCPCWCAPTRLGSLARRDGEAVSAAQFLAHVQQWPPALPVAPAAVNLCEDRYAFLVAFCAIVLRGQINLLPSSRAPRAIDEVMAAHPGCYALGEQALDPAPPAYHRLAVARRGLPAGRADRRGRRSRPTRWWPSAIPPAPPAHPAAHVKTWGSFHASNAGNLAMLRAGGRAAFEVVATVPPQHMYGMEMSVLLPLLGDVGVHAGRPFFPADVAAALAAVPRAAGAGDHAGAPARAGGIRRGAAAAGGDAFGHGAHADGAGAKPAEQRFGAPLLEVFGSTETCVFASRRPTLRTRSGRCTTASPCIRSRTARRYTRRNCTAPVTLADIVTLQTPVRGFRLCGRHADMLEIAGKRASLGDLTRRLLAIPGVRDGVVIQLDDARCARCASHRRPGRGARPGRARHPRCAARCDRSAVPAAAAAPGRGVAAQRDRQAAAGGAAANCCSAIEPRVDRRGCIRRRCGSRYNARLRRVAHRILGVQT